MKNKLTDLNDVLFEQLERLNDDEHMEENFDKELERSKAITNVASSIINNAQLLLNAHKYIIEYGANAQLPAILSVGNKTIDK